MKVLEKIIVIIKNGKAQIPRTKNVKLEIKEYSNTIRIDIENLTEKILHIENPYLFIPVKGSRFWLFADKIPKEIDLSLHEV